MSASEIFAVGASAFAAGLQGVKGSETIYSTAFAAPCTAVSSAALVVSSVAIPSLSLTMAQTAPLLNAGGTALQAYATANTVQANSLMVARASIPSLSLSTPAGSCAGCNGVVARTQVAGADLIACPTISAASQVQTWLAGGVGAVLATAVAPATASLIVPGTGFTLSGTVGAIYGYRVEYA